MSEADREKILHGNAEKLLNLRLARTPGRA